MCRRKRRSGAWRRTGRSRGRAARGMASVVSWRHNARMETLLITDAGGVRTITLNRPDSLNAMTEQMTTELQTALKDVLKTKSVRCLVLTGAGRAFCAGQDVKSL